MPSYNLQIYTNTTASPTNKLGSIPRCFDVVGGAQSAARCEECWEVAAGTETGNTNSFRFLMWQKQLSQTSDEL